VRRTRFLVVLVAALAASGCASGPVGPSQPIAAEQLGGADGIDIVAARATALEFLSTYAASPTEGVGALRSLVAGADLRSWVRWLGVQNREFDGTIRGTVDLRSAAFTASVPIRTAVGAQVDMSASVTFDFTPANGDAPFERTRILDGPITLLQTGTAGWKVVDVTRDGISMDAGITAFDGQTRHLAGVSVRLDSVFRFVPNWQFNVVVTNDSRATIALDVAAAALIVRHPDGIQSFPTVPSRSLETIRPGATVDALIAVPYQESAKGRRLSLPFVGSDDRLRRFEFALGGIIDPLPGPSTGAGSPAPAPS
jgi:hypothetical protein